MTATTKRRATAQEYLSTWAKARRDIDLLLENAVETQQQLHRLRVRRDGSTYRQCHPCVLERARRARERAA